MALVLRQLPLAEVFEDVVHDALEARGGSLQLRHDENLVLGDDPHIGGRVVEVIDDGKMHVRVAVQDRARPMAEPAKSRP